MTPTYQTIFPNPAAPVRQGNCLQAAIASMLDLPLAEVPHFVQVDEDTDGDVNWWTYLVAWLRERGWRLDPDVEQGETYLGTGPSPRGQGLVHIAIFRDGELLHDPHPDGTGVLEVKGRLALRPCDPIPMRDRMADAHPCDSGDRVNPPSHHGGTTMPATLNSESVPGHGWPPR